MDHILNDVDADLVETLTSLVDDRSRDLDFYRERYPDGTVEDMDDFLALPMFTKQEFMGGSAAGAATMLQEKLDDASYVVTTSGTSGLAAIVPRNKADERSEKRKGRDMEPYTASDDGAVLVVHNADTDRNALQPYLKDHDGFYGFVPYRDRQLAAAVLEAVQPECLWTSPLVALKVAERTSGSAGKEAVKRIIMAGEPLSDRRRERLEEEFPNADIYMEYGMLEFGRTGFQCSDLAGSNLHHIYDEEFLYEVIDPQTGDPAGDEGELVMTSLVEDTAIPLNRYRTGDRVEIVRDACGCDRPAIRVMGRLQFDRLKVSGITVYREHFEDALATVSDLVKPIYQIHLHEDEVDGEVETRLEAHLVPRTDADREEFVREEVAESLMENFSITGDHSWQDAVEEGWLQPLAVTFVDELGTGSKSRPVVDHRSDG